MEFEQNTKEWLEWRLSGIGASDAPAIMGKSPYKTKHELWLDKYHKRVETPEERAKKDFIFNKGHKYEAWARPGLEFETGLTWKPALFTHQTFDFIRASLDGWNSQVLEVWECKFMGIDLFTALKNEELNFNDRIPPQYFDQIMQHFFVTGARAVRLTGVYEFVTNKEERAKQKEAGQEQEKKQIQLQQYTLKIDFSEEYRNYINETLAPALFAFWKSVKDGIEPEVSKADVLPIEDESFKADLLNYKMLKEKKEKLDAEVKKVKGNILGTIEKDLATIKEKIEKNPLRNHNKMECVGYKLTEVEGRKSVDYEAAFGSFMAWLQLLKANASDQELVQAVRTMADEPSLEKYEVFGKPSFKITIPKEKKEKPETGPGQADKPIDAAIKAVEENLEAPSEPEPELIASADAFKNPETDKTPRGWAKKTTQERITYLRTTAKKKATSEEGRARMSSLADQLETLVAKKS